MRKLFTLILLTLTVTVVYAQRVTDQLDRGLVAIAKSSGVFISWRVQADEYYDVKYNLYRNGTLIAEKLNVSNYTDTGGSASSTYKVAAVVKGVVQAACDAVTPWNTGRVDTSKKTIFPCPAYFPIKVADVTDRDGNVVWQNNGGTVSYTQNYTINDIALGDVDGDGKIDFIVKRKNQTDADALFPADYSVSAFCRIEVYASTKNYGLLWYIDCGPNTVYGPDETWDAVAYDWDQDGKCEIVYRAYANTIIHKADGTTVTIGSANESIRENVSHTANMTFTNTGNEYLVYINGSTGEPYVTMEYPLKRVESSELSTTINWDSPSSSDVSSYMSAVKTAWGDNYGHRSSKYFVGAPYLDGRKPSLFLARGIYTRHKMIAYDIDPSTHALTEKWTWNNNNSGSAWYGQGYHNFCIADVDEDGRDEIVYGSMVIDDCGKGLSTTGLGHGDASHTGDLDPFRKGLETFACNEDSPANNFRNATTCELYYRQGGSDDDGRSMAGNFSNDYPGCWGASSQSGILALSADNVTEIDGLANNWNQNSPNPIALNFRIYWDGDLLEETVNGPGSSDGDMFVDKLGSRIIQTSGCTNINGTKKNPCAQGDIIGDWREELIFRSADNTEFRIYSTTDETSYRIPSLWYDHQYRQAMVWQTEGYNQPPHTSFFLGDLEGITQAPPPLSNTGKEEIADGSTITTDTDGQDLLIAVEPSKATNNRYAISFSGKIAPSNLTVNVPTIVAGNGGSDITSTVYTCYLNNADGSSSFSGSMRLIKQGNGVLSLAKKTLGHTGQTEVWGGSLAFNGTLSNSKLWLNRHTTLNTSSGTFGGGIEMNYNSTINVGGVTANTISTINTTDMVYNYGSRIVVDANSTTDASQNDQINVTGTLTIVKKDWTYGPKYLAPVLEVNSSEALGLGRYQIGTISNIDGDIDDVIIECNNLQPGANSRLVCEDGKLYLELYDDGEYIGSADNTTGWWSAFSDSYTVESGYTYNFKFRNYGNSAQNYYNWLLVAANGSGHSTDDRSNYAEYFVLRTDEYGWGNNYQTPELSCTNNNTIDWETFRTDMYKGADVDMDVTFVDNVIYVKATITSTTGNVYTYSFSSTNISADAITLFFTVDHSHMSVPTAIKESYSNEEEPTNVIPTTTTYDFTTGSTTSGIVYLTWTSDYNKVGQSGWSYASCYTSEIGGKIAFTRLASSSKMYGFCYRYSGLLCINQSHTLTLVGLKSGTKVVVTTSANAVSSTYNGNYGGTWESSANDAATTYTYTMTSDGDLNLQMAAGSYIYTIVVIKPSTLTLSPTSVDEYDTGIYGSVTLDRTFKVGYSTLCVPFNTTVSEFTGGDTDAYVAYLSGAETSSDGMTTLTFTNTQDIVANRPYIIYLSKAIESAPTFTNKAVYSESAKTIVVDDWSMSGNYEVGKSMTGLYGIANNASIMLGGAGSTLNGFRAFITGPSGSNAKIHFTNGDETSVEAIEAQSTISAIYNANGIRISTLQKGINIVRMSDNTVRKIFVK